VQQLNVIYTQAEAVPEGFDEQVADEVFGVAGNLIERFVLEIPLYGRDVR